MKKNRILSAALLSVLLLGAVSCADDGSTSAADTDASTVIPGSDTVQEDVFRPEDLIPSTLPQSDFGGANYNVLVWKLGNDYHNYEEYDTAEQNGEVLNDAIFNRNSVIEEKFNVVITDEASEEPSARLKKDVMAGETTYQVVADWPTRLASACQTGYLHDLYTVPHLNLEADWWDRHANETYTLRDKLYFTTGDYVLYDKQRILILYFNRTLAESLDISDLYGTVTDGKWTIDLFNKYCTEAVADLDGNGKMGEVTDRFGLISGSASYNPYFLFGAGCTYSKENEDGTHSLAINNDHTVSVIERFDKSLFDKNTVIYLDDLLKTNQEISPLAMFEQGQTLFYHEVAQLLRNTDMDDAYGVLPQPKYDESQEDYLTAVQTEYSAAIGVPSSLGGADLEMTGILLEALSAVSSGTTYPAFIEDILLAKKAPDSESAEILRMMYDHLVFDVFATFQVGSIDSVVYGNLYSKKGENFISTVEKKLSAIEKGYQKIIDKLDDLE